MLFKLSIKNMKKSFKDYAIYFLTLILGVAIFYMFNSLDAQQAMLNVSKSTYQIIELLIQMLGVVSIFIAVILGFLIIYANNFLIKRRKKEFGIYMTLGMGKRQISKILLIETILIGIISLVIGLVIGIFASQLMSIVVAKMFEADMSKFQFVFSQAACIKTIVYFGIMYLLVMLFNVFAISKYKLIDLITAKNKSEKVKIKNTILCVIVFLISIATLGWAYYEVIGNFSHSISDPVNLLPPIIAGSIGTFLFFWSLSGFVLKVVQSCKKIYLRETNMFVLRQINAKINTTVFSMTIICLMLFVTIGVLSSALSINDSLTKGMKKLAPVDLTINHQLADIELLEDGTNKITKENSYSLKDLLEDVQFDFNELKDVTEVNQYILPSVTLTQTLGNTMKEVKQQFQYLVSTQPEDIMKVSDYNKVAKLYGLEEYTLSDNEYIVVCNYQTVKNMRDKALKEGTILNILGKDYTPKYTQCQDGFIDISANPSNPGFILVPDSCNLTDDMISKNYLLANYNANNDKEKQDIEDKIVNGSLEEKIHNSSKRGLYTMINTKIDIYESSIGLSAMVTFIAMYLGIIFLIASSAILALKELSESSDNKERYSILRKIGTNEKMISKSLFMQVGIFFLIPLALAIIHSVFGLKFALKVLEKIGWAGDLTGSIMGAAGVIVLIYGGYFIATYLGSKNIIKE